MTEARLTGWRWVFVSRETGRVAVVQWPNLALWLWILCSTPRRVGLADVTALDVIATAALLWWAVDELARGVNPWRRFLGAGVLLSLALSAL